MHFSRAKTWSSAVAASRSQCRTNSVSNQARAALASGFAFAASRSLSIINRRQAVPGIAPQRFDRLSLAAKPSGMVPDDLGRQVCGGCSRATLAHASYVLDGPAVAANWLTHILCVSDLLGLTRFGGHKNFN